MPSNLKGRKASNFINSKVSYLSKFHDYDFNKLKQFDKFSSTGHNKNKDSIRVDKIARNLVDYAAGRTILETALGIIKSNNINQTSLF